MSLKPVFDRFTSWRGALLGQCEPLLVQARQELCSAQNGPDADDEIGRIEELVRAKLEPVMLEAERPLAKIQQAAEQYFGQTEEPTEQDSAWSERIGQGIEPVRDRMDRRIASLVAQARAAELLPAAPGAPPSAVQATATPAPIGQAPAPPVGAPAVQARPVASPDGSPPPGMKRFCQRCGAKLGPAEWGAKRCGACQAPL